MILPDLKKSLKGVLAHFLGVCLVVSVGGDGPLFGPEFLCGVKKKLNRSGHYFDGRFRPGGGGPLFRPMPLQDQEGGSPADGGGAGDAPPLVFFNLPVKPCGLWEFMWFIVCRSVWFILEPGRGG